jgi:hypothetical protein
LKPAGDVLNEKHRAGDAQRPAFGRTDGESFGKDFAADENQQGEEDEGDGDRPVA